MTDASPLIKRSLVDQALEQLAAQDERLARVVECRVFAGLSEQETAEALDISLRSTQRLFAEAKQLLARLLADLETGG